MNHLEQLLAEWYEYQGYFVRRNVLVGKRPKGGYDCELDIVAFHPEKKELLHVEPSMDADSWAVREKRYRQKFEAGQKHIPELFKGLDLPERIKQYAVFVFASKANHSELAGGTIILVDEILRDIAEDLADKKINSQAIPEQYSLLRSIQFVIHYKDRIFQQSPLAAADTVISQGKCARTVQPGYVNLRSQRNLGRREPVLPGTDHCQYVHILNCTICGYVYGANGSDIHERRCPSCQGGKPGIPLYGEQSGDFSLTARSG